MPFDDDPGCVDEGWSYVCGAPCPAVACRSHSGRALIIYRKDEAGRGYQQGQMPRSGHSHLSRFWKWLMPNKPASINLLHSLAIVVTDVGCTVEKEIFSISLIA
jgi:hypothetical protein